MNKTSPEACQLCRINHDNAEFRLLAGFYEGFLHGVTGKRPISKRIANDCSKYATAGNANVRDWLKTDIKSAFLLSFADQSLFRLTRRGKQPVHPIGGHTRPCDQYTTVTEIRDEEGMNLGENCRKRDRLACNKQTEPVPGALRSMKRSTFLIAWFALASLLFAAPVSAQGPIEGEGSMAVGDATVSVGGGTAILTLPDVPSFVTFNRLAATIPFINGFKFSDDFGDEIGWNVNGSIDVPMGANNTVSLNGFWANINDEDSARCNDGGPTTICFWFPLVDDPALIEAFGTLPGGSIISNAERDVDHWGVSLEVKRQLNPAVSGVTQAPPRRTLAVGADIRGIDQDLDVALRWVTAFPIGPATYSEELDTRYYGAYAAWGGDFPRLVLGGLWERWGLNSTFQLRGGIYYAETDYEGRLNDRSTFAGNITSALTLSDHEVAFIGGLVMETSKRIGQRATLSLKSEYEYYSYVPEMAYNQVDTFPAGAGVFGAGGQVGTVIGDDDAFSMRSSLRLIIGLGPRDLYQEPMK